MFSINQKSRRKSTRHGTPRSHGSFSGGYGHTSRGKYKQKFWSVYELEKVLEQVSIINPETSEDSHTLKHTFETFEIGGTLRSNVLSKGYISPTPIQDKAIPVIINGRDVIGIANTGTGKTAAFLIPLIERVSRNRGKKVLIVTPTRELALQIYEEFRVYSRSMSQYAAVLIGGANVERQKTELRKNPSFVIATPGRLKDLLKQKAVRLDGFSTVVLDETDRMVDIGFITDIKYFISLLPQNRQSLFFSATVSSKVEEIIKSFVKDPITVSVKSQETAHNIEQKLIRIPKGLRKADTLHNLLLSSEFSKVLVFGSTKWEVQKLSDELAAKGHKAGAIHGNKRQNQRQLVLKQFKTNQINVLLATDVASRGLDICDVTHVINYDMPENYDAYVHRIGRTGRANKKGIALTLVED